MRSIQSVEVTDPPRHGASSEAEVAYAGGQGGLVVRFMRGGVVEGHVHRRGAGGAGGGGGETGDGHAGKRVGGLVGRRVLGDPRVPQRLLRRQPLRRRHHHQPLNQVHRLPADRAEDGVLEVELCTADAVGGARVARGRLPEGREARHHGVEQHAQRPHVGRGVEGLLVEDLGGGVGDGALVGEGGGLVGELREAEVGDLDGVVGGGGVEDVLGLEVAVDDALGVHVLHGQQDLSERRPGLRLRQPRALRDLLKQVSSLGQLHHDEDVVLVLEPVG
mmetsp:Transcript_89179/g.238094  ORF Transcript_89179/g.238094 Transcript_89179/m.238094 type:complete len:276 (+) Transcript_89179:16-843(+)